MSRIVVAGDALIDRIVALDGSIREVQGGGQFNAARTIARLGGAVAFLGGLSTDRAGRWLRATLEADGVDLRWAPGTDVRTTQATATLDAVGDATYVFDLDGTSTTQVTAAEAVAALVEPTAALHIGTLGLVLEPIASSLVAAVRGLDSGTLLLLDPNCRPSTIPDRTAYAARIRLIAGRADVIKASRDDLAYLAPTRPPATTARDLVAGGATVVLVTDGGRPVEIVTERASRSVAVPPVRIVDTVGAGDAFSGAFLAHWIDTGLGRSELTDVDAVVDAVRFAMVVASLVVGRAGAEPPTRAEVTAASRVP